MDEEYRQYRVDQDEPDSPGDDYKAEQVDAWLRKCRRLVILEKRLHAIADEQFAMADGLKVIDYSRDRVKTSPTADAIPNAVARHVEIGNTLEEIAASASERARQAVDAIGQLEDPDEMVALMGFYVQGRTWEQLSVDMPCSYSTMMRLRKRGLVHIYDRDLIPHMERDPRYPAI